MTQPLGYIVLFSCATYINPNVFNNFPCNFTQDNSEFHLVTLTYRTTLNENKH